MGYCYYYLRRRVYGGDAGEEVTAQAVAAGRRGGVGAVGRHHVVDRGHVDSVVSDADEGGGDERCDPGDWLGRTS